MRSCVLWSRSPRSALPSLYANVQVHCKRFIITHAHVDTPTHQQLTSDNVGPPKEL